MYEYDEIISDLVQKLGAETHKVSLIRNKKP